jgi:hypothetical protein
MTVGERGSQAALQVGTQIHTAPEAFGKVMSTLNPSLSVRKIIPL